MAKYKRFFEYLNEKGKTQDKATVKADGDTGPNPTPKPPKTVSSGKNWHTPNTTDGPDEPYSSKDVKGKDYRNTDKGLGYTGDKRLKYEPETTEEHAEKNPPWTTSFPNQKESTPWEPNTEAFLKMTENMSISEFTDFLKQRNTVDVKGLPRVYAEKAGNITPDPLQAIRYVSFLAKNESFMETLVAEMENNGLLGTMLRNSMNYSEGVEKLAESLKDQRICRRLVKSIVEMTDKPAAETETPMEEKDKKEKKAPQKAKGRKTASIDGQEMDMGSSDVVSTKEKKMESALLKALAEHPVTRKFMRDIINEQSL